MQTCKDYIPDKHRHNSPQIDGEKYVRLIAPPGYGTTCWLENQANRNPAWRYLDLKEACKTQPARAFFNYLQATLSDASLLLLDHPPTEKKFVEHLYALDDFLLERENIRVVVAVRRRKEDPLSLPNATEVRLEAWKSTVLDQYFSGSERKEEYLSFIGKSVEHHIPQIMAWFAGNTSGEGPYPKVREYLNQVFDLEDDQADALQRLAVLALAPTPDVGSMDAIYEKWKEKANIFQEQSLLSADLRIADKITRTSWTDDNVLQKTWEPGVVALLRAWLKRRDVSLYSELVSSVPSKEEIE